MTSLQMILRRRNLLLLLLAPVSLGAGIEEFIQCGEINVRSERLACYDRAYSSQSTAAQPGSGSGVQQDVTTARKGAPLTAIMTEADFGLEKPIETLEVESIQSEVTRSERDPYDRLILWLKNDQIWKQIDDKRFRLPGGEPVVVIGHGAFGSYHLSLEGKSRWIGVRRIR